MKKPGLIPKPARQLVFRDDAQSDLIADEYEGPLRNRDGLNECADCRRDIVIADQEIGHP